MKKDSAVFLTNWQRGGSVKIVLNHKDFGYLTDHSADSGPGILFLATHQNRAYWEEAHKKGSTLIEPLEAAKIMGLEKIKIVGVCGTNGKTTTSAAIYSMLLDLGYKVALQGTRGFFINDEKIEAKTLTTPMVLGNFDHIRQAIVRGCDFFVMEVSSHAIAQERIEGITFALKVHTNITSDHLDFHKTQDEYVRVKNSFFSDETPKLINRDDPNIRFNSSHAYTYAIESPAMFKVAAYSLREGISAVIQFKKEVEDFHSSLYGFFNLYNLVGAIGAVKILTQKPLREICDAAENFGGVSGRMEVLSHDPLVIVDFAHTDDGMKQVLSSFGDKNLVVVFGAGGDRDRTKRPRMGRVASQYAKRIYITSDNPRSEDPRGIIEEILQGIENRENVHIVVDRSEAIREALAHQKKDEVVLILGKGDESVQIFNDRQVPFDDREVVREVLKSVHKVHN